MRADLAKARCRTCGSTLDVLDSTDGVWLVRCIECRDEYEMDSDALDGGATAGYLGDLARKPEEGD